MIIDEKHIELIDIISIESTDDKMNVIDIEVEDDHTFCLANGIISHNSAGKSLQSARGIKLSGELSGYTGTELFGSYPLKGKPINVKDVDNKKLLTNKEFTEFMTIMNLKIGEKVKDKSDLYFGKIAFMTDADCIDKNLRVITDTGLVPIKNININDKVLTSSGKYKKVLDKIHSVKNKIIEFTVNNKKFRTSKNHKIPVIRNNEVIVIKAKDVKLTDKILIKK